MTFTVNGVPQPSLPLSATRQAKLPLSSLPTGTDSITASYSGDGNHAASTSAAFTEVVNGSAVAQTGRQAANGHVVWGLAWRLT